MTRRFIRENLVLTFTYTVLYHKSGMIGVFQHLFDDKVLEFTILLYLLYLKRTCLPAFQLLIPYLSQIDFGHPPKDACELVVLCNWGENNTHFTSPYNLLTQVLYDLKLEWEKKERPPNVCIKLASNKCDHDCGRAKVAALCLSILQTALCVMFPAANRTELSWAWLGLRALPKENQPARTVRSAPTRGDTLDKLNSDKSARQYDLNHGRYFLSTLCHISAPAGLILSATWLFKKQGMMKEWEVSVTGLTRVRRRTSFD